MDWQRFPYQAAASPRRNGEYVQRPVLTVRVSSETEHVNMTALVDSGTDVTMLNTAIAELLHIPQTERRRKATVRGIGGEKEGFLATIHIQVPEFPTVVTTKAIFVPDDTLDIILGQDDFFRNFSIRFERAQSAFYIKPV